MGFRELHFVLQKRMLIFSITLVFFVIGLLYALLAGRVYETRALLMLPPDESTEGMLASWMEQLNLPSMVLPTRGGAATAALIRDLLESRRLGEFIITELDLEARYRAETMSDAFEELKSATKITVTTSGMIDLRVRDEDSALVFEIARRYIAGLDSMSSRLRFTRAESSIRFISDQLEKYSRQLRDVRGEIAEFQQRYGIVDFEEQVKGAIEVAAAIKIRTILAEIERDLLREFATTNAVEYRRKEAEYRNLQMQLERIVDGDTAEAVFVPLGDLPELYQRYAELRRDLEVNERVYSYLLQRLEESGIDKARNTPTVLVVDEPNVPEKPVGLSRFVKLILVTGIGFVWVTAVVAIWGWLDLKERTKEEEEAFREVVEIARRDLEKLRRLLRL